MTRENHDKLREHIDARSKRIEKAEQERYSLMSQTTFLGTLGLVFILPVVLAAYLGRWLDSLGKSDFSIQWTLVALFVGILIGAMNVYFLIRSRG
jgi:ATP synthase protein I